MCMLHSGAYEEHLPLPSFSSFKLIFIIPVSILEIIPEVWEFL